jgi:hypothetical protein
MYPAQRHIRFVEKNLFIGIIATLLVFEHIPFTWSVLLVVGSDFDPAFYRLYLQLILEVSSYET